MVACIQMLHPTDTHTTKYYKAPKGDQLAISESQKLYILLTKKWGKGRPRGRMTSPSDTVFAAMFLRARMTSPSDGSPNRVVAAMFLRARMTSPSDGGPNTVFAAPFYFGYIYHENTFCQSVPATVVSCSQHGGHH